MMDLYCFKKEAICCPTLYIYELLFLGIFGLNLAVGAISDPHLIKTVRAVFIKIKTVF